MRRTRPLGAALVTMLAASVLSAHHSFSAIYDESRSQVLDGVVTEFRFVHPHPILVVAVQDAEGARNEWRAEMDNRFELEEIGITAATFQTGDRVRIAGSPGRNQAGILYLRRLERPADGLRYEQVDSTPRLQRR